MRKVLVKFGMASLSVVVATDTGSGTESASIEVAANTGTRRSARSPMDP